MEAFEHISKEKQERIIVAAMSVFAEHGYKKASVSDIAKAANISKAMVFTYFGTKRGCYEYMCQKTLRVTKDEIDKAADELAKIDDYFDRLILSSRIKLDILRVCRPLFTFSMSLYLERDVEVLDIAAQTIEKGMELARPFLRISVENKKFKNPDNVSQVIRITQWLTDGCAAEWDANREGMDFSEMFKTYLIAMDALKHRFYKEEYL